MTRSRSKWLVTIILGAALSIFSNPSYASQDGETAVRNAAAGFYSALNVLFTGKMEPMRDVWSHADDVTYMGPDGPFLVGWRLVSEDLEKQAAMKLGGHIEPDQMHITAGQEIAVVENYEKGENTNARGKPEKVSLRATGVFRKEDGQWKMIGHHTDLLPYLK